MQVTDNEEWALGKQLDKKNIKKVINALREKSMKWSELKVELGIPERKLSRILEYLQDCGLAKKHKEDGRFGRWSWYEYIKTYDTKEDYEIALKHSEELFLGLDAILAEEINLYLLLPHPIADVKGRSIVTEGNKLKPFVEEHLKTEYPTIYKKLIEFREALSELKKLKENYDLKDMFSHFKIYREDFPEHLSARFKSPREDTPKPIKQLRKQRLESFRELADYFLGIKLKVKMGEPLKGSCQLCPKVHIESKNL